jgi:hypothetical protein
LLRKVDLLTDEFKSAHRAFSDKARARPAPLP